MVNPAFQRDLDQFESAMNGLPAEVSKPLQISINLIRSSLESSQNPDHYQGLQQRITHLNELSRGLPIAEKTSMIVSSLHATRDKEELIYYLNNPSIEIPEEAKARIAKAVRNFDQNEMVGGTLLILRLSSVKNDFLRSLVLVCIEGGANPATIARNGISVLYFPILFGDRNLVMSIANQLGKEELRKCLLSEYRKSCVLCQSNLQNISLTMELIEKAGISPDTKVGGSSLFNYYVKKANHSSDNAAIAGPLIEKLGEAASKETLQEALSSALAERGTNSILRYLISQGVRPEEKDKEIFKKEVAAFLEEDFQLSKEWSPFPDDPETSEELRVQFYLSLLETNDLPLFVQGKLTIDLLPKNRELEEAVEKQFSQEVFRDLRPLCPLIEMVIEEEKGPKIGLDLYTLREEISKVQSALQKEQFSSIPGFAEFKEKMGEKLQALEERLQEREDKIIRWVEKANSYKTESDISQKDLTAYLVRHQKWEVLSQFLRHQVTFQPRSDKSIYHFLLDKAFSSSFEEKFHGGFHKEHAGDLMDALEQYSRDLPQDAAISQNKRGEVQEGIDSAAKALALLAASNSSEELFSAYKNHNSPIIVSVGYKKHGVLLALYQSGGKTKALLFNTGDGIQFHPQGKEKTHAQTYLAIEDIPEEFITLDLFKQFEKTRENETIEPLYELFRELEKKGGKVPPSENPFDYEMKQMGGTCSAQSLMAFLRYHLLQEVEGTTLEKMGLYKHVKARTLKVLAEKRLSFVEKSVSDEALARIKEIECQLKLKELSESEKEWEAANNLVVDALRKEGMTPLVREGTPSVLARGFIMERNVRLLAKGLDREAPLPDLGAVTPFFELLREKRSVRIERLFSNLDRAVESGNLVQLVKLFKTGWARQISIKSWLSKEINNNYDFWHNLHDKGPEGKALLFAVKKVAPELREKI